MSEPSPERLSDGQHLRRYLLGDLSEEEEAALERAYFSDPTRLAQVELAEHDLMDEYASNAMTPGDRRKFERAVLVTPEGQAELAIARALRSAELPGVGLAERRPGARLRFSRPRFAWAAGIALVAVGISMAWQFRDASERGERTSLPSATSAPPVPTARPRTAAPTMVVATLLLTADLVRNEGHPPTLTASTDTTHIDLLPPADLPVGAGARARIETAEGREIWSGPIEPPDGGRRVRVRVPAAALGPGDYLLLIVSGARRAPADDSSYYFRVRSR